MVKILKIPEVLMDLNNSILVVDDDESMLYTWKRILAKEGIQMSGALSAEEALKLWEKEPFGVIFTDFGLPGEDGASLLKKIKEKNPNACVNVITGMATIEGAVDCMRIGACDYIAKPANAAELAAKARRCLEHQRQNAEMGRLREEVEMFKELSRMKSEFVSTVSHELRTPLFCLQGAFDLLMAKTTPILPAGSEDLVEVIRSNMDRASNLVANIFNFSRLERGALKGNFEQADIGRLAERVFKDMEPLCIKRDIRFTFNAPGVPMMAEADTEYLGQLLINLVGNAVKFTPAGGRIEMRLGEETKTLWVEVADSGIGIAPENQARIFDQFYQVDSSLTREAPGAGIGLALVKAIAELHGGGISVESALGKGSCFRVTLPKRQGGKIHV